MTPEINLLPQDDLESRPGGKFLKWALSWGKKIVVLTELMVVLAFLSRFWLDSSVADLSEEIDRRKTIIQASSQFENEFKTTQSKINQVKTITNLPSPVVIYDITKSLISPQIMINEITISGTKVKVQGSGEDRLISALVASFKSSQDFSEVILEKVSKQTKEPYVDFSLTAIYIRKT